MVTLERIDQGSASAYRPAPRHASSPVKGAAIARPMRIATAAVLWPTRLLPAPRRKAMQALAVFRREIRDVVDGKASWTMKLALLTDWRAEIATLYAGRP